jgi:hypothetical protein
MTDTFVDPMTSVIAPQVAPEPQGPAMQRDAPEPDEARAALVTQWQAKIIGAKAYWAKDFKRMKLNMEFAKLGSDKKWKTAGNYTANILQRHINQKVASLYAKNPQASVERAERLDFKVWDGTMEMLQTAQVMFQRDPTDENANAVIQDVMQGIQRRKMFDKIGETMKIMFHYFLKEGNMTFKRQAKQAVRRSLITGICYCEVGFQRMMEKRPEVSAQIEDTASKIATMEALTADLADGELREGDAEMENLKLMMKQLQDQESIVVREGPTFDWPKSTDIIPDPNTVQIEGWIGTGWLTRELRLTVQEIKEVYSVDIGLAGGSSGVDVAGMGGQAQVNTRDGNSHNIVDGHNPVQGKTRVWKVWDKRTGHEFILAEGYPDFISEPAPPDAQVEQFFPVFGLQFNPVEDGQEADKDTRKLGLSDIELLEDMQKEYNTARQGLREHRHANRPGYVAIEGTLEDEDKAAIQSHPANAVVMLKALLPGQKIEELIDAMPKIPIDPAVYDVNPAFDDIMRTAGSQEANLGGTSGDTATEASIAEGSRQTSTQSNVDDLDDFLTSIARATGQIMLINMGRDQVEKIVGPGAIWPEFTKQEIAEEMFLKVQAGSSGRPNKQLEVMNFERIAPLLMQIPGVRPQFLAKESLKRLDDNLTLEDMFLDGLPSIIALNSMASAPPPAGTQAKRKKSEGRGAGQSSREAPEDPNAQGAEGVQNAPNPQVNEPGPQAAFPDPTAGLQ